jgi:hypothetical protein
MAYMEIAIIFLPGDSRLTKLACLSEHADETSRGNYAMNPLY